MLLTLVINYSSAVTINSMGFHALKEKKYQEAVILFMKAVDIDLQNYHYWNNLGVAYMKLKKWNKAKRCFENALHLNPDYSKARFNLALTYFYLKKYVYSFKVLLELRKRDPGYVRIRFNRDKAKAELEKALKEDPENPYLKKARKLLDRYK